MSFSVPEIAFADANFVEIRDESLRVVAQAGAYERVELDAGVYVASVVLPSGEERVELVTVRPGEPVEVYLGSNKDSAPPEVEDESRSRGPWRRRRTPDAVLARLVSLSHGFPSSEQPPLQPVAQYGAPATNGWEYECEPPAPGVWCLQIAEPHSVPVNCVLPVLRGVQTFGGTSACRVRLAAAADGLRVSALPISTDGSMLVEAVGSYTASDHLPHAAELAASAREMLLHKLQDPIGAALGGYALLRLGGISASRAEVAKAIRDETARQWATNLANWFPELPDGPVIAGELAARATPLTHGPDELRSAHTWMREAARRGTPVFADGLSLLSSRLGEWRAGSRRRGVPRAGWEETPGETETFDRLLDLSLIVDFSELTVTFRASDPLHPVESDERPPGFYGAEGWYVFPWGYPDEGYPA